MYEIIQRISTDFFWTLIQCYAFKIEVSPNSMPLKIISALLSPRIQTPPLETSDVNHVCHNLNYSDFIEVSCFDCLITFIIFSRFMVLFDTRLSLKIISQYNDFEAEFSKKKVHVYVILHCTISLRQLEVERRNFSVKFVLKITF